MLYLLLVLVVLAQLQPTAGSAGDRSSVFRTCVVSCPQKLCPLEVSGRDALTNARELSSFSSASTSSISSSAQGIWKFRGAASMSLDPNWVNPSPWMAFMQWDCVSECKYTCMQEYSAARRKMKLPTLKFYGKWPFTRVLGVQELFSSFASFLNGVPHAVYLFTPSLRAKYAGPKGHYMRIPLYVHSAVAMNSWLWSTIFHARDIPFTEAADYFFATMQLMFSMWMAIYRMSRRSPPIEDEGKAAEGSEKEGQPRRRRNDAVVGFLGSHGIGFAFLAFYAYYVHSMLYTLFDYGWHMKINGVLVAFQALVWLLWSFTLGRRRQYRFKAISFLTLVLLAASCEVFDFPPYLGLIDAHATWHCLTAPMIPLWYAFWIDDTAFETRLWSQKR